VSARCLFVCGFVFLVLANSAHGARYQRTKDGKTLVWNSLRGVAQEATWSGLRDLNGYGTGQGTLTWYRLESFVNSYTGKMVRGKFEGLVIREQGNTRLEATFANGEKAGPWLEPGSSVGPSPTPKPTEQPAKPAPTESPEEPIVEQALPSPSAPTVWSLPTPIPNPSLPSLPTSTSRPTPTPTLAPTATPQPTPLQTPKPTPTPMQTPSPIATPAPTQLAMPSPSETPTTKPSSLQERVSPGKSPPQARQPAPARISPAPSPSTSARQVDANLKRQMIADLKKQTESVLAQVRDATGNFLEVERLEQVKSLPSSVTASVTLLANQAQAFRAVLGYDVTYYEVLTEIETIDALVLVDDVTRDLVAKNAPVARKKLLTFVQRYAKPTTDSQKPLWRYLDSLFAICDRLKTEAAALLPRARSLESAGKKTEALREYREIYRLYPNPDTAEKIRQLQSKPQ
jgi:hypothetical protein